MTTFVDAEIVSQPNVWRRAVALAPTVATDLPRRGERIAVVGCGTSWFIATCYAALRERSGGGITDAFPGSEFLIGRDYDRVVLISRSGTTTEIIDLLRDLTVPTTLITADSDSPAALAAQTVIEMPFADEKSVIQTRFATAVLTLLRRSLSTSTAPNRLITDAERALNVDIEDFLGADQVTFLGRGWCVGLAHEAALKTREAAQFWAESYPAMDYRHGPISIAQPGRLVWSIGQAPDGLAEEVTATGATFVHHDLDPQAALIVAQRFAVALAVARGLDPDRPRALTRSVILA